MNNEDKKGGWTIKVSREMWGVLNAATLTLDRDGCFVLYTNRAKSFSTLRGARNFCQNIQGKHAGVMFIQSREGGTFNIEVGEIRIPKELNY